MATKYRRARSGKRASKNAGMAKRWAKYGRKGFNKRYGRLSGAARLSKKRKLLGIKKRKKSHSPRKAMRSAIAGGVAALMNNPRGRRYSRNSGLGSRIPVVGGIVGKVTKPFTKGNAMSLAGIAAGVVGAVAAVRYAPVPVQYNVGYWGVGLTALAGGAVTAGAAMLAPAWAPLVGLGALAVAVLRGAITVAPRVLGYVTTPLLEWSAAAPVAAPASGAVSGFRAIPRRGMVAGFLDASPSAYSGGPANEFGTNKNVF